MEDTCRCPQKSYASNSRSWSKENEPMSEPVSGETVEQHMKGYIAIVFAALLAIAVNAGAQQPFRESLRAKADASIASYKSGMDLSGEVVSIDSEWMDDLMKAWI